MDRKRKRSHGTHEADWTATRCQRLLRPIASRIAPLRKLAYITDSQRPDRKNTSKTDHAFGAVCSRGVQEKSSDDPTWLRRPDAHSGLRNYSSKNRGTRNAAGASVPKVGKVEQPSADANLISLPTPFRARALRRNTPGKSASKNDYLDAIGTPCIKDRTKFTKRQKKDPFSFAPVAMQSAELNDRQAFEKVFELHQGVVDGFSLLLQRTEPRTDQHVPPPANRRGARSLFSACLRRVPDYIQAEEDWRKTIDPDDETDVCAEVYEELEELGTATNGWTPLREVVRAHGVKLVNEIIRDKLVSTKTRAELANMPLEHGAVLESEKLAIAYAHTLPLKRPADTTSPLFNGCLADLAHASIFQATYTSATGPRLRILNSLYGSKRLHTSWIATKDMNTTLAHAVRSLASPRAGNIDDTIQFLGGIVMRSTTLEQPNIEPVLTQTAGQLDIRNPPLTAIVPSRSLLEAVHKTIENLLTVLTTMAIINSRQDGCGSRDRSNSCQAAMALLQTLATAVLLHDRNSVPDSNEDRDRSISTRIKVKVLASALVVAIEQRTSQDNITSLDIEDLVLALGSSSQCTQSRYTDTEDVAVFICNVAFCCGQSLNFNSQDILEDLVRQMMSSAEQKTPQTKSFMQILGLETALAFAALSSTRESRAFAETMEKTMRRHCSLPILSQTSRVQNLSKRDSFRWEEGLCEWIAATPLTVKTGRSTITQADLQTSPLAVAAKEDRVTQPLPKQPSPLDADLVEMDDSGYVSIHETPIKRVRNRTSIMLLPSSPDVLNDSPPRHIQQGQPRNGADISARELSAPSLQKGKEAVVKTKATHNKAASHMTREQRRSAVSLPPENCSSAKVASVECQSSTMEQVSETKSRKQRILRKYGPPKSKNTDLQVGSSRIVARPSAANLVCKQASPQLSIRGSMVYTPPRSSVASAGKQAIPFDMDAEDDELAMSCKKAPARHCLGPARKATSTAQANRNEGLRNLRQVADQESDDELG